MRSLYANFHTFDDTPIIGKRVSLELVEAPESCGEVIISGDKQFTTTDVTGSAVYDDAPGTVYEMQIKGNYAYTTLLLLLPTTASALTRLNAADYIKSASIAPTSAAVTWESVHDNWEDVHVNWEAMRNTTDGPLVSVLFDNIYVNETDFSLRKLHITPFDAPWAINRNIVTGDRLTLTTDNSGDVIQPMLPGTYSIEMKGPTAITRYSLGVPVTSSGLTINASDWIL